MGAAITKALHESNAKNVEKAKALEAANEKNKEQAKILSELKSNNKLAKTLEETDARNQE